MLVMGAGNGEWKAAEEVVFVLSTQLQPPVCVYSLCRDLANRIKSSLRAGRKDDPKVRLEIPFDTIHFDGGLRMCGKPKKVWRGNNVYIIAAYTVIWIVY